MAVLAPEAVDNKKKRWSAYFQIHVSVQATMSSKKLAASM
jgi:hypothetical protein